MVFEHLDGPFRSIDSMIVGFDKLNGTVARGDKCFDGRRCLIVGDVEGGHKSFGGEGVKNGGKGGDNVVTLC